VRLELMARRPRVVGPGGVIELSHRHAEILAVMLLAGRGLTAEQLCLEVYGGSAKPVTLRAEMSRLRRALKGMIATRPYGFAVPVRSDVHEAEQLLKDGDAASALSMTAERLLPWSQAPLVREARERLEGGLRTSILLSRDPELLAAWCRSAAGREDELGAQALLAGADGGGALAPAARAHLSRIRTPRPLAPRA